MLNVHFDITPAFKPYFTDNGYGFPFHEFSKIKEYTRIEGASISHSDRVKPSDIEALTNLKLLITRSVGTDHIDLDCCRKHKIAVYHIEDYGADAIADHTLALILTGVRKLPQAFTITHQGSFNPNDLMGMSLKGKTLGIIGTGRIGLKVIERAKGFGLRILAYDIIHNNTASQDLGFSYVTLNQLVSQSDIISLHTPLTPQTKHLIDTNTILKMKPGVVLVNTARGGIVNTKDLIATISRFSFVGLDVVEDEQDFNKDTMLLKYPNVFITPHIAYFTDDTVKRIAQETYTLIEHYKTGNPNGRVV